MLSNVGRSALCERMPQPILIAGVVVHSVDRLAQGLMERNAVWPRLQRVWQRVLSSKNLADGFDGIDARVGCADPVAFAKDLECLAHVGMGAVEASPCDGERAGDRFDVDL